VPRRCDPFADVDHVLFAHREALCTELGRSLPSSTPLEASSTCGVRDASADTASCLRACETGDADGCFWAGYRTQYGLDVAPDGSALFVEKDPESALGLYRRSCDGGHVFGCLLLVEALSKSERRAELVEVLTSLCESDRESACAKVALAIPAKEQSPALARAVAGAKTRLATACVAGRAEACDSRALMEEDDRLRLPWYFEACERGSAYACRSAQLPATALDEVNALVASACPKSGCRGLFAALSEACVRGNAAACYLRANACTNDEAFPRAVRCAPRVARTCGPAEDPPGEPPSCLPRALRGRLLIDELAQGLKNGWRAYELCDGARNDGYLLEHAGPLAATPDAVSAILETHRGAVEAMGAHATGFGRAGVTGMIDGDVRLDLALRDAKRAFRDTPETSCFGVALMTYRSIPVPQ
jgi:TPR repeat protein